MTTHVRRIDYPMDGVIVPLLVAADAESQERIGKCKRDVIYRIVPKRHNNPRFQRMVERMIRDLWENQDFYESETAHREALKICIGWVEDRVKINKHGDMQWITKGLDFSTCGQDERERFLELLRPYYAERLGWEALSAYEGI